MEASSQTEEIFEELGLQGGGYTWEGEIRGIVSMKLPESSSSFDIGAEADNAYVYSENESALKSLQELVTTIDGDTTLLKAAIEQAGDDIE
jgi:hypothetical protein